MGKFKKYTRVSTYELRPYIVGESIKEVAIADQDIINSSPKKGDMIARDPKNHKDKWLLSEEYIKEHLTRIHFQIGDVYTMHGVDREVTADATFGLITFTGVDDNTDVFKMGRSELLERGYHTTLKE